MLLNKLLLSLVSTIYLSITTLRTSLYVSYIPEKIYKIILALCLILLAINEVIYQQQWTKKDIVYFAFLTLMGSLTYKHDGILGFTPYYLLFSCRKWQLKDITKFLLGLSAFLFLFIIFSAKLGLIDNYFSAGRIRQYLGYRYALFPQAYLANIIALYLYYRQKKVTIFEIIILFIFNYTLYQKTNSRLSFYCSICLLIISLFLKYQAILANYILQLKLIPYTFYLFTLLSLILAIFYQPQNNFLYTLNYYLGNRLQLASQALDTYKIGLLGKHIDFIGNGLNSLGQYVNVAENYNYVDNLYIRLMLQYGCLFVVMICFLSQRFLSLCQEKKQYYLLTLVCFIALRCFIDDLSIFLYYNSFWFIICNYLYQHKYQSKLTTKWL